MHLSPFDDLGRVPLSSLESPSRRIGVILSVLFLASLGTVATVPSEPRKRIERITPNRRAEDSRPEEVPLFRSASW